MSSPIHRTTSRSALTVLATLIGAAGVPACSTQFIDPIVDKPPPSSGASTCSGGYALKFDGSSYGTMTRLIQDDFAIEALIKTSSSPQGQYFSEGSAIVFADVEAANINDFAAATLSGKFVMSTGGPDTAATSASDVVTNEWVHVAATRSRATGIVLVFVNGVLEGSSVGNKNSLGEATDISFGGRAGRNFYVGLMAEIRLWRTVRTQSEIVANMRHRMTGNEPGLVGYYRLDEHAGATAHDSSPSRNDAGIMGAAQWVPSNPPLCD